LARAVVETAGVDEGELAAAPLDCGVDAIPGSPRLILDDGDAVADEAIEQGRLADVRTAHHGDEATAHPHTLRRTVAATPRKRPLAPDLPRIVASLDKGSDRLVPMLSRVTDATESVPLLFAAGRRALLRGERDSARVWLTRAQSRSSRRTPEPLRARLAFELGCVLLDDGGTEAAESVIAWAESFSRRPSSDVLHLRALIADRRGERTNAIAFYRRAIATARTALSPLSRVLELRNLAETLAHESPTEALTMYRHALETLRAHDLDPRLAPALHNGFAYAAMCAADFDLAEKELDAAGRFGERSRAYLERSDLITAVALLFWRSVAYRAGNASKGAKGAAREACELRRRVPVRVSPSWWAREIVDAARTDGGEQCADD